MNCAVAEQEAIHANIGNQSYAEAEINKQALTDLFDKSEGFFSNGPLKLEDVVYRAINEDRKNMADILCELAILKDVNSQQHAALKKYLEGCLRYTAMEMNEMANSQ